MRPLGLGVAAQRVAQWFAFGLLPAILVVWWLTLSIVWETGDWGFDLLQFWQGGNDVVHGRSPYPSEALLETADDDITGAGIRDVFRFPYPAPAAFLLAPLGALPFDVAMALWAVACFGFLVAALRVLGVRDWRVYGVVLGAAPVIGAVRLGTLTPLILLLLAVAWRWRDRRWVPAAALAGGIVLKMFLWPMLVWLLATRRTREAARSALLVAAAAVAGWAAIGFDGLTLYPELLDRLTSIVAERGFSLAAVGSELGLPDGVARALPLVAAVPLLALVVALARREDGDRRAFSLAVITCIVATPIVWLHYFTLLAVPLALARPRLAPAWALLALFWLAPAQENRDSTFRLAVVVSLVVVAAVTSARTPPAPVSPQVSS